VPARHPAIGDQLWANAATAHFSGEVIVGSDVLEL
jgi:hypothetical protein